MNLTAHPVQLVHAGYSKRFTSHLLRFRGDRARELKRQGVQQYPPMRFGSVIHMILTRPSAACCIRIVEPPTRGRDIRKLLCHHTVAEPDPFRRRPVLQSESDRSATRTQKS